MISKSDCAVQLPCMINICKEILIQPRPRSTYLGVLTALSATATAISLPLPLTVRNQASRLHLFIPIHTTRQPVFTTLDHATQPQPGLPSSLFLPPSTVSHPARSLPYQIPRSYSLTEYAGGPSYKGNVSTLALLHLPIPSPTLPLSPTVQTLHPPPALHPRIAAPAPNASLPMPSAAPRSIKGVQAKPEVEAQLQVEAGSRVCSGVWAFSFAIAVASSISLSSSSPFPFGLSCAVPEAVSWEPVTQSTLLLVLVPVLRLVLLGAVSWVTLPLLALLLPLPLLPLLLLLPSGTENGSGAEHGEYGGGGAVVVERGREDEKKCRKRVRLRGGVSVAVGVSGAGDGPGSGPALALMSLLRILTMRPTYATYTLGSTSDWRWVSIWWSCSARISL